MDKSAAEASGKRDLSALTAQEWFFAVSAITVLIFSLWGNRLLEGFSNFAWLAFVFLWLFAVVLGSALAVVRHADHLATKLGEPYGTMVLTLSVTTIEVLSITAVVMHGSNNVTLVRDTLFAVIMIILNGMVGLSLLIGGWRHHEQQYNLQGANAYLGVIIPLAVLSLVLPEMSQSSAGPTLARDEKIFLVIIASGLYVAFLALQTGRHRTYFMHGDDVEENGHQVRPAGPTWWHALMIPAYMAPVVFLAEQLAHPVDYLIETLGVPVALGGVLMALLVATPEAIGAVRAASANHLQRSVNIFLGSVLSTIGLTIPAMVVITHMNGMDMDLGVEKTDLLMLLLTLTVSVVTFSSGRTNVLQGAVHLILFAAFLLLIFQK
ncbi:calcium:proton antiporter [Sinorhizobium sp. BG8]|uniref:calcium:proton antiporter n=1 Tax=Sinorhizobium sp. BG8 TaxID=2613773 RepID=UPI00193DB519|nr:calcium:proton antiporter [Sinorhizobium sp. BG8]QRM56145.1 calcium:proton antiporter [Sinorhizobium sp. BG8]